MSNASDALAKVEQSLSGLRYGLGARALGAWRSRPRYRSAASGPRSDSSPSFVRARALLEAGALETAAEQLELVCAELPTLNDALRPLAAITAVDLALLLGDREHAERLGQRFRSELSASTQGVGRLECLGVAKALVCPDGGWNLLGASRRISDGALEVASLALQVGASPKVHLAEPQLGLLYCSALWSVDPERATRFLSQSVRALGVRDDVAWRGATQAEPLASLTGRAAHEPPRGPLVSVLVAAHHAERTLAYALESLLAQSYASLEILVADDASRDGTLEVMRRYAAEPRVRLFRSETNQGAYNVRNQLAEQARGELITFHDADDWAFPSRIAAQVAALRSTGAHGVVTGLLRMRPSGALAFFKNQRAVRLSPVSLLLAKDTFRALGAFRSARVGADHELATKLVRSFGARSLVRLRAPWMLSRLAPGSATSTAGTESSEDGFRSPSRRRYSQLVFDRYLGSAPPTESAINEQLREAGNWADPAPLIRVTGAAIAPDWLTPSGSRAQRESAR